jgi:hypothetical protein
MFVGLVLLTFHYKLCYIHHFRPSPLPIQSYNILIKWKIQEWMRGLDLAERG